MSNSTVMRGQCDASPMVTFPAARHHRPLATYQIILLGDRGTCMLTTCPGLYSTAGQREYEPATC